MGIMVSEFTFKGMRDSATLNVGDIAFDKDLGIGIQTQTGWLPMWADGEYINEIHTHPTNCKCCGAILTSWKCEYCGAEY